MGLFGKPPVIVKCSDVQELGRLLNWLRRQYGLSGLSMRKFEVITVMRGQLSHEAAEVDFFEVSVPRRLYESLKDKYLKRVAFDESQLQEEILADIKHLP